MDYLSGLVGIFNNSHANNVRFNPLTISDGLPSQSVTQSFNNAMALSGLPQIEARVVTMAILFVTFFMLLTCPITSLIILWYRSSKTNKAMFGYSQKTD